MKEKLPPKAIEPAEGRRFKLDKRWVGLIIGLVGLTAVFAGGIDDVSTNIYIAHQVDNRYPPVSLREIERADREIVLFAQEASRKTVEGQDPLSNLSAEEKMKLAEDIQALNQENVRSEYRRQLFKQKPREILDLFVLFGGGLFVTLIGGSIYFTAKPNPKKQGKGRI